MRASNNNYDKQKPLPLEPGFSLIEVIVAMAIMFILAGIGITMFHGSKATAYAKETITIGAAYAQAVSGYQAAHALQSPVDLIGASKDIQQKGPLNPINKSYLGSIPDGISGGRIGVSWEDSTSASCQNTAVSSQVAPALANSEYGWVTVCINKENSDYIVRASYRPDASTNWDASEAGSCWVMSSGIAMTKEDSCSNAKR